MTLPRCDLHIHTHFSDGRASPGDVARHAASLGLACISITDHDNLRGLREAIPVANQLNLPLLPGIELTTFWPRCAAYSDGSADFDLLGYAFLPTHPAIVALETAALADLFERVEACCALFSQDGFELTLQEVFQENPYYAGAMQLIDLLCRKGYAQSFDQALPLFQERWRRVRPCKLGIHTAIEAIHAAGGVAVLAHPTVINCGNGWLQFDDIAALVDFGLDGLEIYHHKLNTAARQHFHGLARRFGLIVTGGSDEHGWPEGFPRMGNQPVTPGIVRTIQLRAKRYRAADFVGE